MDQTKSEYEFLDLTDINEEERSSLTSALFSTATSAACVQPASWPRDQTPAAWADSNYDLSSCSSGTPGPPTASSSLDSLASREGMAPGHSPPPPPLRAPFNQPPPPLYAPPWPPLLPNVYVSQVTANVNVHGYMSQYYQPQYHEPRPRRGRRGGPSKRAPSPPRSYLYYPQYYPPQPAQGAPLYHLYPPLGYLPGYSYPYMEYPLAEEPGRSDKPEDYSDAMLEHEHPPDGYYPQHPPAWETPRPDCPVPESYLPFYPAPPPVPPPHQFNVHAKNFVRQSEHRSGLRSECLPISELRISSSNVPAVVTRPVGTAEISSVTTLEAAAHEGPDVSKPPEPLLVERATATVAPSVPTLGVTKMASSIASVIVQNKVDKNPAPFVSVKSFVKNSLSQPGGVIIPQQSSPFKAPFASKHRKEATVKPRETSKAAETLEVSVAPVVLQVPIEIKPNPTVSVVKPVNSVSVSPASVLSASPVSIPPTPIVSKAPFSRARKISPPPVEPLAPPAPSAADFPPPPAPRRPSDRMPAASLPVCTPSSAVVASPVCTPSPARSWASLFGPVAPAVQSEPTEQSSASLRVAPPPASVPQNRKPVAMVGPYDASVLQRETPLEKRTELAPLSYSEKAANIMAPDGDCTEETALTPVPPHIDDPNSYRMGEFLSKYRLSHQSVWLQPRGMSNRSNYCYINAILQALIACPPFYNMLRNLPHQPQRGKSSTPIIDAMVELIGEFAPLPGGRAGRREETAPPVGPPLEPSGVLRALRAGAPAESFHDGRQEDAEEFLGCLLNGLNDEMLELIKLAEPEETKDVTAVPNGNEALLEQSDDDDDWKVMGPKNKGSVERRCLAGRTPLSDIFRGQLRSRLQRTTDTATDVTHCVQPFFTLPLDIERSSSVREALERVAGRARVEGVTCPWRGRPVEAWQQWLLERLPTALVLQLKCFHCRPGDGATTKIVKAVDYPVDLKIDPKIISPKMKYSVKQRTYKLFAVVYHEGAEAEKGHYVADAYHGGCGGWLRYDDSVVTSVTEQQVLHPRLPRTPYLLLYRRQDTVQAPRHSAP